tara:strand:- start:189 stop:461 length:273 start_codon:yes stop_codon:yes gene_type:complete
MLSESRFLELSELNPEALLVDGLNKAVIGFGSKFTNAPVAIYDYDKCIEIFMEDNGWDYEEAMEWMSYNVVGAWMGEGTPIFMRKFEEEQ